MGLSDADRAAIRSFPALGKLVELREAGWILMPQCDADHLIQVRGLRTWPQGYADVFQVRYVTDAAALRCDHAGCIVWRREGTLLEVIDGLLTLPPPDAPDAPRLIIGIAPLP